MSRPARTWLLAVAAAVTTACATRSPVHYRRATGKTIEEPGHDEFILKAQMADGQVTTTLTRKTPHETWGLDRVTIGRRFTWKDTRLQALGWGVGATAVGLTGLGVRASEGRQRVETAAMISGEDTQDPSVESRPVPADSRARSNTTFGVAGALGTVALSQLAAMALPTTKKNVTEARNFVSRRWTEAPEGGARVTMSMAGHTLDTQMTDNTGTATLSLASLNVAPDWAWTVSIRASTGEEATQTVSLRGSTTAGQAAGRRAGALVTTGHAPDAIELLAPLTPTDPAFDAAWTGMCTAAAPMVRTIQDVQSARALKTHKRPPACVTLDGLVSARAADRVRAALSRRDLQGGRAWNDLTAASDQPDFDAALNALAARLQAEEKARDEAEQRRLRRSWQGRTARALATCAAMQQEIATRKRRIQHQARQGNIGGAQDSMERFKIWMERTGQPKLGGALESIQDIRNEMRAQNVDQEVEMQWMFRVRDHCGKH